MMNEQKINDVVNQILVRLVEENTVLKIKARYDIGTDTHWVSYSIPLSECVEFQG